MSSHVDDEPESPPEVDQEAAAPEPVHGILELAANGRARCRACNQNLPKGEWRLGERAKNPFGEGETTYWFHAACGAIRRAEVFMAALSGAEQPAPIQALVSVAEFGQAHRRAGRFSAVGVAPSGRARCRHCRELIDKGQVRIELSIFHDGRFDPMGYLHARCLTQYVGAVVPFERLAPLTDALTDEQRQALRAACGTPPPA